MDPTKPILDLYGDSFYSMKEREPQPRPQNYKSSNVATYNQNTSKYNSSNQYTKKVAANEPSYAELEDKYQELYQAYKDKSTKLSQFQTDNDQLRNQNSRLRTEIDKINRKNEQLNSVVLNKNLELEDAYRKLQDEIKTGGRVGGGGRTNDAALDRLEDGLREAINSNFQILRQSAISELKHYMH